MERFTISFFVVVVLIGLLPSLGYSAEVTDLVFYFPMDEGKDSPDIGDQLLVPVSVDVHRYKVTVTGSDIAVFIDGVEIGKASDSDHPKGTAGIRYETIVGTVDNFHVYGPAGPAAVEAKGKLAMTWG